MTAKELLQKVSAEYQRLNIRDGRYTREDIMYKAPEQLEIPSNQVKALIVIKPEHYLLSLLRILQE